MTQLMKLHPAMLASHVSTKMSAVKLELQHQPVGTPYKGATDDTTIISAGSLVFDRQTGNPFELWGLDKSNTAACMPQHSLCLTQIVT